MISKASIKKSCYMIIEEHWPLRITCWESWNSERRWILLWSWVIWLSRMISRTSWCPRCLGTNKLKIKSQKFNLHFHPIWLFRLGANDLKKKTSTKLMLISSIRHLSHNKLNKSLAVLSLRTDIICWRKQAKYIKLEWKDYLLSFNIIIMSTWLMIFKITHWTSYLP